MREIWSRKMPFTHPRVTHPMMSLPQQTEQSSDAIAALEWRVYLARRHPARAILTVLVVLGAGAWALSVFRSPLPAVAAVILLLGAVGDFLFPVRYRLSPEVAEARSLTSWRKIAWKEVKRVYVGDGEIKLSPLAHPGRREEYRGVLLRCEADQEAVLAAVQEFRDAAARS
jgi:hypothetical protein